MAQLDISSFTTQTIWLVAIYFVFYFFMLNVLLPKIAKVLKARKYRYRLQIHSSNSSEQLLIKSSFLYKDFVEAVQSLEDNKNYLLREDISELPYESIKSLKIRTLLLNE